METKRRLRNVLDVVFCAEAVVIKHSVAQETSGAALVLRWEAESGAAGTAAASNEVEAAIALLKSSVE